MLGRANRGLSALWITIALTTVAALPPASALASEIPPSTAGTSVPDTIISTDTTWRAEDGPFTVVGRVQVAAGATLTIAAGAEIDVQRTLEIEGGLTLAGTATNPVSLRAGVTVFLPIGPANVPGRQVRIEHAEIQGPAGLTGATAGAKPYGLTITDSRLTDMSASSYIFYPDPLLIERNVFTNVDSLRIGGRSASAVIQHNRFRTRNSLRPSSQIESWGAYAGPLTVVGNVFEQSVRPKILEVSVDGAIDANSNYFATTDRAAVDAWVLDKSDDLSRPSVIQLDPILTEVPSEVPVVAPTQPLSVMGVAGDKQATLSWSQPSSDGGSPVTGYTVTSTPGGATTSVPADATSATLTGLTNGTNYTFAVTATNPLGDSLASSVALVPAGVPIKPSAPTAIRGDGQATVSWFPTYDNGSTVTSYTVAATPGGNGCTSTGYYPFTCTVDGLANGTAYTFTVTAVNAVGDSPASAASEAVTPAGIPIKPATPTATGGDGRAVVSWTATSGNGSPVTGYIVTSSPDGKTCTTTGALSCTLTGLTNGTAYTFTISATNAIGTSPASGSSNTVTPVAPVVTPPPVGTEPTPPAATAPSKMKAPRVLVQGQKAVVRWKAAVANGSPISRYVIDLSKGKDKTASAGARKTVFKRLKPGRYRVRIAARNAIGTSPYSAWVTVRIR